MLYLLMFVLLEVVCPTIPADFLQITVNTLADMPAYKRKIRIAEYILKSSWRLDYYSEDSNLCVAIAHNRRNEQIGIYLKKVDFDYPIAELSIYWLDAEQRIIDKSITIEDI